MHIIKEHEKRKRNNLTFFKSEKIAKTTTEFKELGSNIHSVFQ